MNQTARQRLMIFAKAPEPGRVKTRLVGEASGLSAAQTAELHAAFVRDVLTRHQRADRHLTLWRAGDLEHPFWATLSGVELAIQGPGDLGARMAAAFEAELAHGQPVVILGTDSPSLPPGLVDAAFDALNEVPCVVGPACDGGYYLMGLSRPAPALFSAMPWGTSEVLPGTLKALTALGLPHRLLPFWYDVDRAADLDLLAAHLPTLTAEGQAPAHTAEVLQTWAHEAAPLAEETGS